MGKGRKANLLKFIRKVLINMSSLAIPKRQMPVNYSITGGQTGKQWTTAYIQSHTASWCFNLQWATRLKQSRKIPMFQRVHLVRARPFLGLYANTKTVAREGAQWPQSSILSEEPGLIPSTTTYSSSSGSLTSSYLCRYQTHVVHRHACRQKRLWT